MYSKINVSCEDKENVHPNLSESTRSYRPIEEGDFSKIGTSYVLDGERLRVKSITYKEDKKSNRKEMDNSIVAKKNIDQKQIVKLEYLEKMGVLNEEERQILAQIRNKKNSPSIQKLPISNVVNPFTDYPYKSNTIPQTPQNNVAPQMNYCPNPNIPNMGMQQMNFNPNRRNVNMPQYQNQDYLYPTNNQMNTVDSRYGTQNYKTADYFQMQPQSYASHEDNEVGYGTQQQNYYY